MSIKKNKAFHSCGTGINERAYGYVIKASPGPGKSNINFSYLDFHISGYKMKI